MEKEQNKVYNLRITDKELVNPKIKKALIVIMQTRLAMHKYDKYLTVSNAEYNFIKAHWSWTPLEKYAPKKKEQLKGELGKYCGKRVCLRGQS